jgi:hypothetical protein
VQQGPQSVGIIGQVDAVEMARERAELRVMLERGGAHFVGDLQAHRDNWSTAMQSRASENTELPDVYRSANQRAVPC